ncbi:MAG: pyridoxamine 5'-phosphate oxidase family protein [Oscillospiraceae bacterium]|nr:pyridoxamine 5'-phosphate oxidase family protein [Oscillospiraceae bacterium]
MINNEIKKEICNLIETSKIAYVSSIDADGIPNTKAMLTQNQSNLTTHYFSTNFSAKRTQQFIKNPNASIYFCDEADYKGLMLIGKMEVLTDKEHKTMLWHDGDEIYYPNGIDDEDYCVFKFTAVKGNYYHGLKNCDFNVEDI